MALEQARDPQSDIGHPTEAAAPSPSAIGPNVHDLSPASENPRFEPASKPHGAGLSVRRRRRGISLSDGLMIFFTALIFVATAAYVIVAMLQRSDFQAQSARDERAWVGPVEQSGPSGLHAESAPNGDVAIVIPYINTGKTPAFKVGSWISWTTIPAAANPATFNGDVGTMALFPNGIANVATVGEGSIIPKSVAQKVRAGKLVIYVYGAITYRDTFGHSHWTDFCFSPSTNIQRFGGCPQTETLTDSDGQ